MCIRDRRDVAHAALMSKYTTSTPAQIAEMHNPPEANWDSVATVSYTHLAEQITAKQASIRKIYVHFLKFIYQLSFTKIVNTKM